MARYFFIIIYKLIAKNLPKSSTPVIGKYCRRFRGFICSRIFKKSGSHINVERGANFGLGASVEIGDYSGIGINANIPDNTIIGKYVMMGPDCIIYRSNHEFEDLSKPMCFQGHKPPQQTIIGDDVWIGGRVIITPGRKIGNGVIIGAGSVVTKDLMPFGIYAGNPAKLIRYRNE